MGETPFTNSSLLCVKPESQLMSIQSQVKYRYYYKVLQFKFTKSIREKRQRLLTVEVIHANRLKYLYEFINNDPQLAIVPLRGSDRF